MTVWSVTSLVPTPTSPAAPRVARVGAAADTSSATVVISDSVRSSVPSVEGSWVFGDAAEQLMGACGEFVGGSVERVQPVGHAG